ncbi:hypothetical protein MBLNU230_g1873t1 [Neophaeotheca triangularis]
MQVLLALDGSVIHEDQIQGEGQWRWFQRADEERANALQLRIPSDVAAALRLGLFDHIDHDKLPSIVWHPAERTRSGLEVRGAVQGARDGVKTADEAEGEDNDSKKSLRGPHDPTNNGQNDQSGDPARQMYQTWTFGDKTVTIDRSNVHATGTVKDTGVQPHKLWMFNGRVWTTWPSLPATGMDWADTDLVRKLNKWREQVTSRAPFPTRTGKSSKKYSAAQERWFESLITENDWEKPKLTAAEVTSAFNAKFNQSREENGVYSKLDRVYQRIKKERQAFYDSSQWEGLEPEEMAESGRDDGSEATEGGWNEEATGVDEDALGGGADLEDGFGKQETEKARSDIVWF